MLHVTIPFELVEGKKLNVEGDVANLSGLSMPCKFSGSGQNLMDWAQLLLKQVVPVLGRETAVLSAVPVPTVWVIAEPTPAVLTL